MKMVQYACDSVSGDCTELSDGVSLMKFLLQSDEKISNLEPGSPRPDQDVCHYGDRRKAHETLHPVVVELLSFFVGQAGYGSPIRHTTAPSSMRPVGHRCAQPAQPGLS